MGIIPETGQKEVNAVEEILKPDEKVEEPKEEVRVEETPAEEPEKEPEEVKKPVPFHQHPRFLKVQKEAQEAREEARVAREALQEQKKQSQQSPPNQKMPQAFVNLFGSNEEAWAEWQNLGLMTKDEVEQRIQARFDEARQGEEHAQKLHQDAVLSAEEQLATLTEDSGIDFSIESDARNRLLDIAVKYKLLDENGVPNLEVAYQIFQDMYPPEDKSSVVNEKKNILAKTGAKTNSNTKESDVYTPKRLAEIKARGGIHSFLN